MKNLRHIESLVGDSTLDNGFWVDGEKPYVQRFHSVPWQTALALTEGEELFPLRLANFAVDGFRTSDVLKPTPMNLAIPADSDHLFLPVSSLEAVANWQPHTVILSVGGNDYRVALQTELPEWISLPRILLRLTPDTLKDYDGSRIDLKELIKESFREIKTELLRNYKIIIDRLITDNPQLRRLVLVSQYYPALTMFTCYFIYTGFAHVAAAEGILDSFTAVQQTMEELYKEIITYVQAKDKEIIFLDMTSSLNPLAGYHSFQIEPNAQGSKVIGRLLAHAIRHSFAEHDDVKKIIMRLEEDEDTIRIEPL